MTSKVGRWGIITLTFAGAFIASLVLVTAGQTPGNASVAVDNDDIGGVVTGARGPEASTDRGTTGGAKKDEDVIDAEYEVKE